MKPRVTASHEDVHGQVCVDVLAFDDCTFGWCAYRRDPEENHGWRPLAGPPITGFATEAKALQDAITLHPWAIPREN